MRKIAYSLLLIALAALLFWMVPALIQESMGQPEEASETAPVRAIMLEAVGTLPGETLPTVVRQRTVEDTQRTCTAVQPRQPVITVTCDGNGSPLGSSVWFHAVYEACPPEAEPGGDAPCSAVYTG